MLPLNRHLPFGLRLKPLQTRHTIHDNNILVMFRRSEKGDAAQFGFLAFVSASDGLFLGRPLIVGCRDQCAIHLDIGNASIEAIGTRKDQAMSPCLELGAARGLLRSGGGGHNSVHIHVTRWHSHYHMEGSGHPCQGRFKAFPIEADDHLHATIKGPAPCPGVRPRQDRLGVVTSYF